MKNKLLKLIVASAISFVVVFGIMYLCLAFILYNMNWVPDSEKGLRGLYLGMGFLFTGSLASAIYYLDED